MSARLSKILSKIHYFYFPHHQMSRLAWLAAEAAE